jgi:hypothetical protein
MMHFCFDSSRSDSTRHFAVVAMIPVATQIRRGVEANGSRELKIPRGPDFYSNPRIEGWKTRRFLHCCQGEAFFAWGISTLLRANISRPAQIPHSGRSAPALAQHTGGNLLLLAGGPSGEPIVYCLLPSAYCLLSAVILYVLARPWALCFTRSRSLISALGDPRSSHSYLCVYLGSHSP